MEGGVWKFGVDVVLKGKRREWEGWYEGRKGEGVRVGVKLGVVVREGVEGIGVGVCWKIVGDKLNEVWDGGMG